MDVFNLNSIIIWNHCIRKSIFVSELTTDMLPRFKHETFSNKSWTFYKFLTENN